MLPFEHHHNPALSYIDCRTWATVLPPELPQGHRALGYADEEVRRSAVVALLRKLAKGCMHARPRCDGTLPMIAYV